MANAEQYKSCNNCWGPATKRCTGCSKVYFCSEACQKKNWPVHIFDCNPSKPPDTAYHLARAVASDMIPSDPQTCVDYGFARCNTEEELSNLISLYIGLIKLLGVDPMDLHRARCKGQAKLVVEIMSNYEKLPEPNRGVYYSWFLKNLHIFSSNTSGASGAVPQTTATHSTSDVGNLSVEDLVRLLAEPNGEVIPSVGVDYGFWNCKGPVEQAQLKAVYRQYFQHPSTQEYALHEACILGKTFEHVSSVVPMNSEQRMLFKRLMSNPYPLLDL